MPAVRRSIALVLAVLAASLGLVALASPAQAASRSTWCTDWRAAGVVAGVGKVAERACVQYLSTGYFRTVAEVTVEPQPRVRPTVSPTATVSPSPTATPRTRDGLLIRNIYVLPGHGASTKYCRVDKGSYANLRGEIKLGCYTDYVTRENGTARARTWSQFTVGGTVTGLPLTGWIVRTF